jgi:hypothetical protein
VYSISSLGQLTGPVFSVGVQNKNDQIDNKNKRLLASQNLQDVSPGKVSIISPATALDNKPSPNSVNTPLPTKIFQSKNHPYKVGTLTNSMSSLVIYYNEDQYLYMEDVGYYAVTNVAKFIGGKLGFFFWLGVTQEGGEYYLRWMTKSIDANGFSGKNTGALSRMTSDFGFKEGIDYNLTVEQVGSDKLFIHTGQLRWLVDINRDQNQNWQLQNIKQLTLFNTKVETISTFEIAGTTIMAYFHTNYPQIWFTYVDSTGKTADAGTYTSANGVHISYIDCKTFYSGPACLIFFDDNTISDLSFDYDEYTKTVTAQEQATYYNYANYRPSYIDWNEDYLIAKTAIKHDANN